MMSAQRKPPNAVYFDSNVLRKAGWPDPSAALLELFSKLKSAGVQACMVALVQDELAESWIRDLVRDRSSLVSKIRDWPRRSLGLGRIDAPAALPSVEEMQKHFAQVTAKLMSFFRVVPTTTKPTSYFTRLALRRGGAFVEGGKGFNDTVILVSVIEDMEAHGIESALFVSADTGFKSEGMCQVTQNRDLRIVADIEVVNESIDQLLSQQVNDKLAGKREELLSAAEEQRSELHEFLRHNLTLTRDDVGDDYVHFLLKIEYLKIVEMLDAHSSPFELGQENREENRLSVDVKVLVRVERAAFPSEALLGPGGPQDVDVTIQERAIVVTVEALAEVSKRGIEMMKFLRAYPKRRSRFGDLLSG